jgi:FAD/FMN-containing dehydrogenase
LFMTEEFVFLWLSVPPQDLTDFSLMTRQERMVIHVEAQMTIEALVRAALEHGMVPKVVPPFRDGTVGGAVRSGHD